MKMFFRLFYVVSLATILALPLAALADEPENLEADAKSAESAPPVIPHAIADNTPGETCLGCHRTGVKGAPQTPHPERLNCIQCHVRSDLSDRKPGTKKGKKVSSKK